MLSNQITVKISVVVPLYNEEENIDVLFSRLLAVLENLEQIFRSQGCFVLIKLIRTASIPVIKLTLDTSIEFLQPAYGEPYYQLNRQHFAGPIEADITIETLNSRS